MKVSEKQLSGTVALGTGGSRGIGAGIVSRLAAEGAAVAFTYVSSETKAQGLVAEVTDAGGNAEAIEADCASESGIRNAVKTAVQAFGPLDIFVNSANLYLHENIATLKTGDLGGILNVNVRAAAIGIRITAVRMGFPGSSIYSMTEAALVEQIEPMSSKAS